MSAGTQAMAGTAFRPDVYAAALARLSGPAARRTRALREEAFERFRALGFPTLRDEDWRFTSVAPIAATPFEMASPDGSAVDRRRAEEAALDPGWMRLVFVNGRYAPGLSSAARLERGLVAGSLSEALASGDQKVEAHLARYAKMEGEAFTSLNTALMQDGAFVLVDRSTVLEESIHLVFFSVGGGEPAMIHPRNLIVVGESSQVTILESYLDGSPPVRGHDPGDGGALFTNAVTEIVAEDGAVLDHYRFQREGARTWHVGLTHVHQGRSATVSSHAISLGASLARNNITAVLDGEGGHATLNGLYLADGTQHVDNHLRVEHRKPHCDSREVFKGVLEGHSHAVFSGRIVVHKDAQKTDAKQTNMNLLLSDDAQVDSKPQLEIFADDVKCTHAATIGQLDDEAVFYLRSRGVPLRAARDLLVYAFAAESLERVRPEPLRRVLHEIIHRKLDQAR